MAQAEADLRYLAAFGPAKARSLADLVAVHLDRHLRSGSAIPDGYRAGGDGGAGALGASPVESAVLARAGARDEHADVLGRCLAYVAAWHHHTIEARRATDGR